MTEPTFKVRMDRAALAAAATWVGQVASKKAIAAMTGMRITAEGDGITLQCFDFETSHSATVAAEVLAEGAVLVNATFLRQIVTAIKSEEVVLVHDGARLTVGAGRSTYRLGTMQLEDFAIVPKPSPTVGTVARDDLAEAVGIVETAAGRDIAVPELLAMNIHGEDGALEFLTTDRFRVHQAIVPWEQVGELSVRIPAMVLAPAIKGLSGEVQIGFDGGLLSLTDGERVVTTRVLDTKWPRAAVLRFLDGDHQYAVEVDTDELASACKRISMVTEEGHDPISLTIHDGEIEIAADSEASEGVEVVPCEGEGDLSLSFNPTFLVDALLASGASRMRLAFTPPGAKTVPPIILRPLDSESSAFVVMPRRSTK